MCHDLKNRFIRDSVKLTMNPLTLLPHCAGVTLSCPSDWALNAATKTWMEKNGGIGTAYEVKNEIINEQRGAI